MKNLIPVVLAVSMVAGGCTPQDRISPAQVAASPTISPRPFIGPARLDLGFEVRDLTGTWGSLIAVGDRGIASIDSTGYLSEVTDLHSDLVAAVGACGKKGSWAITRRHVMELEIVSGGSRRFRLPSEPTDLICIDGQLWSADSSGSIQLFDLRTTPGLGKRLQLAAAPLVALEETLDGIYAIAGSGQLFFIGFDIERRFEGHEFRVPTGTIDQAATGLRCPTHLDSSYGWVYVTQPCIGNVSSVFRDGTVEVISVPGKPTRVLAHGGRLWVATRTGFINYFKVESGDHPSLIGKRHVSGPIRAMRIFQERLWVAHGDKITRVPFNP